MDTTKAPGFDLALCYTSLETEWLGHSMWYYKSLPSTNSHLKEICPSALTHGLICITDDQYEGRGQYNRVWATESYKNLTFSFVLKSVDGQHVHLLNIATASILSKYLRDTYSLDTKVKWPNDVYVGDKKIAGLLTEASFCGRETEKVIVGIGININHEHFTEDFENIATSIYRELGVGISREEFLSRFLPYLENMIEEWSRNSEVIQKTINQELMSYGKWVKVTVDGKLKENSYKVLGVDKEGYLILLDEELQVKRITHQNVRFYET